MTDRQILGEVRALRDGVNGRFVYANIVLSVIAIMMYMAVWVLIDIRDRPLPWDVMPACISEDIQQPKDCKWDAHTRGENPGGHSFYYHNDGIVYVN